MSTKKKFESLLSQQVAGTFSPFGMSSQIRTSPSAEDKTLSLFQPDILLPTQYFATTKRKDHLEPEKKLMLAVLEDAVLCFQNNLRPLDPRGQFLFREAEEWILDENTDWLFSFDNTCEVLGFDPKYMRDGLMRWKQRKLAERPRAQIYHLAPRREPKKGRAHEATATVHKFLEELVRFVS